MPSSQSTRPHATIRPTGPTPADAQTRPAKVAGPPPSKDAAPGSAGAGASTAAATASTTPSTNAAGPAGPAKPADGAAPRPPARPGGRRVKLTLSRIDPFTVMKIAFLLSVALGIAGVVAVAVLWGMLNGMGVFSTITDSVNELQSTASAGNRVDIGEWFSFGRVISLAVIFGFIDVILMMAIATLTAFIYNICATLLGGVQLTLSDD